MKKWSADSAITAGASISINRTTSTREDDFVSVRFEDESSGIIIMEAHIPMLQYAKAITGQLSKCFIELNPNIDLIGKRSANKTERLFIPAEVMKEWRNNSHKNPAAIRTIENYAARDLLVDGWFLRGGDIGNMHRRISSSGDGEIYDVILFRWENKDGTAYIPKGGE